MEKMTDMTTIMDDHVKQCRRCGVSTADASKFYHSFLAEHNYLCKACAVQDVHNRRNGDLVHLLADRLYNAERRRRQKRQCKSDKEEEEEEEDDGGSSKRSKDEEDSDETCSPLRGQVKRKKQKTSSADRFRALAERVYRRWNGQSAISGSVEDPKELCITLIDTRQASSLDQEDHDDSNHVLVTLAEARMLARCRDLDARKTLLLKLMASP